MKTRVAVHLALSRFTSTTVGSKEQAIVWIGLRSHRSSFMYPREDKLTLDAQPVKRA
jgi:hypothetical protein